MMGWYNDSQVIHMWYELLTKWFSFLAHWMCTIWKASIWLWAIMITGPSCLQYRRDEWVEKNACAVLTFPKRRLKSSGYWISATIQYCAFLIWNMWKPSRCFFPPKPKIKTKDVQLHSGLRWYLVKHSNDSIAAPPANTTAFRNKQGQIRLIKQSHYIATFEA